MMSVLLEERTPAFRAAVVLVVALTLAGLAAATLLVRPALAATITVNTTADEDNIDGDCSLREAIIAANTDAARDACNAGTGADTDIINVPAGTYTLTLLGAGENAALVGDLDITGSTTINGAGARTTIVRGGPAFNDRIFENTPVAPGGTTTISGLTITGGNAGTLDGGGVRNAAGNLTLREVAVDNNVADDGGGVDHLSGNLIVERSTISNSTASDGGDGGDGGAIQNAGTLLTITNSTITNNNAVTSGGAIDDDDSATTITDSTIANNTTGVEGGGAIADTDANETFKNTIVAKNTDTVAGTATDNCEGPGTTLGNNIEDLNTCGFTQATDKSNTDPLLGPLANNGGQTDTRALLAGSPAIDTGDSDAATDQRGITRPQDGDNNGSAIDDIGAFELRTATISVDDVREAEGTKGTTTAFGFTVSLSGPSDLSVAVDFATADGTAKSTAKKAKKNDFTPVSGDTLTFAPGETSKTVTVNVKGDKKKEKNETFFVNLSNVTDAAILDDQGTGTIQNDDRKKKR